MVFALPALEGRITASLIPYLNPLQPGSRKYPSTGSECKFSPAPLYRLPFGTLWPPPLKQRTGFTEEELDTSLCAIASC